MDSVRRTEIAVIQIPYVMDNVVFHILLEWVPLRMISEDWEGRGQASITEMPTKINVHAFKHHHLNIMISIISCHSDPR
jgi:hypothetical protein